MKLMELRAPAIVGCLLILAAGGATLPAAAQSSSDNSPAGTGADPQGWLLFAVASIVTTHPGVETAVVPAPFIPIAPTEQSCESLATADLKAHLTDGLLAFFKGTYGVAFKSATVSGYACVPVTTDFSKLPPSLLSIVKPVVPLTPAQRAEKDADHLDELADRTAGAAAMAGHDPAVVEENRQRAVCLDHAQYGAASLVPAQREAAVKECLAQWPPAYEAAPAPPVIVYPIQ